MRKTSLRESTSHFKSVLKRMALPLSLRKLQTAFGHKINRGKLLNIIWMVVWWTVPGKESACEFCGQYLLFLVWKSKHQRLGVLYHRSLEDTPIHISSNKQLGLSPCRAQPCTSYHISNLTILVIVLLPQTGYLIPPMADPLWLADSLVQERRNYSALAMELRLSYINPSLWCPIGE